MRQDKSSRILLAITCIVLGLSVFAVATIASLKRGSEAAADMHAAQTVIQDAVPASGEAPAEAEKPVKNNNINIIKTEETTTAGYDVAVESRGQVAETAVQDDKESESLSETESQTEKESLYMVSTDSDEAAQAEAEALNVAEEAAADAARRASEQAAAEEAARIAAEEAAAEAARIAAEEAAAEEARKAAEQAAAEEAARIAAEEAAAEAARIAAEEAAAAAQQSVDNSGVTYSGDYDYSADAYSYGMSGGIYGYSQEECYLLACTVSAEVGWSPYDTMVAVANIILNRAANAGSIRGAVFARGQFAVTWDGALLRTFQNGPRSGAVQAAQDALNGVDTRPRPYYYFNNRDMGYTGEWIGDEYFYLID